MATPVRRASSSLSEHLFNAGYEFNFFQAVRLLSRIYTDRRFLNSYQNPALARTELVRFHAHQRTSFPPSDLHEVQPAPDNGPAHMTVAFMGLTGPNGALPMHYTQQVIARKTAKQHATAAFLDIFNHRLISLFYLAWEKHHFFASFERNGPEALDNGLTQYLFDLIGLGNSGLRNRLKSVPDAALLFYSGILAQRPRPAISLSGILRDYFRVPVEVEQFRGKWLPVAEDGRSDLASDDSNNQLSFGALAGDAVWNQQARARIKIGPLDHTQFRSFLPGGHAFTELMELATFYVDRSIEFDVQLILLSAEIPACRLEDRSNTAPRLGMSSWVGPGPFASDARDTLLEAADMQL